tara:strand:- start:64 stop:753 length:690 start_codon:yes stop_codon:yes gene_type:complete
MENGKRRSKQISRRLAAFLLLLISINLIFYINKMPIISFLSGPYLTHHEELPTIPLYSAKITTIEMSDIEGLLEGLVAGQCHYFGPFKTSGEVIQFRDLIDPELNFSKVRETAVLANPDYLVYVDRRSKITDLRRLIEEFRSRFVEVAIVSRGFQENVLSLGLTSSIEEAEDLRAEAMDFGYPIEIEVIERAYESFGLEVFGPIRGPVSLKRLEEMPNNVPCYSIADEG